MAAALVAVDHFILLVAEPAESSTLHHVAAFMGSFGVGLFFLISGFVIPQTLRRGSWDYAARRIFRIYPVAIAGAGLGAVAAAVVDKSADTFWSSISLVGNLQHYNGDLLMPIYWTLTIEVAFYVLAGLVGLFTDRGLDGRSVYYILLGVLAATIVVMKAGPAGSSPLRVGLLVILCCWPMLLIGWLCYLRRSGHIDQPLLLLGVGLAFVTMSTGLYPYFGWRLGAPSWLLAFAVFSGLVFGTGRALPRPVDRALSSLGVVTFSLYVVHVPVADVLAGTGWPLAVSAAVYVVVVGVLSVGVHWVAEKPGIVIGKRLADLPRRRDRLVEPSRAEQRTAEPATAVLGGVVADARVLPPVPILDRSSRRGDISVPA